MGNVVRKGDVNTEGAAVLKGIDNVLVNGKPIAVTGMPVAAHKDYSQPHSAPVTAGGSSTVFANGKPVITTRDNDSCGHKRVSSSSDVIVGR